MVYDRPSNTYQLQGPHEAMARTLQLLERAVLGTLLGVIFIAALVNGLAVVAGLGVALALTAVVFDRSAPRTPQRVAIGPGGLRVRW